MVQHAAWAPLTAFTAALLAIWWLMRSRFARLVLDHPNERSLHAAPTPRTGGLGILAGIILAWAVGTPGLPPIFWTGVVLMAAVSIVDDVRGLPAAARFPVHLVAAALVSADLLFEPFGFPAVVVSTLAIAWMANLYNFMDGSDGLAGGMAVFGFTFYGIAAWIAGAHGFAEMSLSIAAAAAAFLIFNFHPARMFMGDAGAVPLGFIAAALGLIGWLRGYWPWWFAPLVFSPFIVDASVTLARRLARRERVWQAHRDHYYQRLVQLGWGHRGTALAEYALMLGCGGLGLAALGRGAWLQGVALAIAVAVYLLLIAAVELAWRKRQSNPSPSQPPP